MTENNEKSLLAKILEINEWSDNESYKSIASFILNNINKINDYTIFYIAKKTFTSPSTVTRFCKRIGLNGFKSLSSILSLENQYKKNDVKYIIKNNTSEVFFNNFKEVTVNSILNTFDNYSENISKIREAIKKAKKIFIFGKGGQTLIIKIFVNWLVSLNYNVTFSEDHDQQRSYSNNISDLDLIIILSYSLSSNFFNYVLKNIKDSNKIFITKNLFSPFIDDNSIVIEMGQNESIIENIYYAEISTLIIFKLIYYSLLDEDQIKIVKHNKI